ncbi:hypothetical protein JCM8097_003945 [Rhodosporidiobolus ruineniae]
MAEKAMQQLRTNVERLGARLGENLAEHSRDLGLVDSFASGTSGGAGKYLENGAAVTPAGTAETKRLLASKSEREREEGLKRVVAMMTKSLPVSTFFPLVTSLLTPSTSLQSRSLISLYIVHCASHSPELALLSINAYQKDLSDPNPLLRAGAISTLSKMGLPDIRELVGMAIQKGARDSSWYVRRATADAVRVLFQADPSADNLAALLPTLSTLLDNASPLTLGAALAAWEAVCPNKWELVHLNYRRWCKLLVDVEEWGQVVLLRVLARYGRTFFLDPAATGKVDADAELALRASEPLLQHLNPAVVSATIKLQYYLSPPLRHPRLIRPLLRLLHAPPEIASLALEQCALIAEDRPQLFADHLGAFFVRFEDGVESRRMRLRVVVALAGEGNIKVVLKELLTYVKDPDAAFSRDAVTAIGTCAQRVPAVAGECLKVLIKLLQSPHEPTVSTAVLVLRTILLSPSFPSSARLSRGTIIARLASFLCPAAPGGKGKIQDPHARATVYWLVGQYAADEGLLEGVGPDVVRLGARGFADESAAAKLHLITLSAKLLVLSHSSPLTPHLRPLALLFDYLALLARYDVDYEVRDRARFLAGLVAAGGVGRKKDGGEGEGARVGLDEEAFRRGVQVEELTGGGEKEGQKDEEQRMTAEQVRQVLFEGKGFAGDLERHTSTAQLGTFALSLSSSSSGKRPFSPSPSSSLAVLPPYPSSVPPSAIRDPPVGSSSRTASPAPGGRAMQGFGSNSFARPGSAGSGRSTRAAREKVVLVPTSSGNAYQQQPQPARRRIGMDEFLAESEEEEEEESSEAEESEEDGDEDEEEEEDGEEEEGEEEKGEEEDSSEADETSSDEEEEEAEGRR